MIRRSITGLHWELGQKPAALTFHAFACTTDGHPNFHRPNHALVLQWEESRNVPLKPKNPSLQSIEGGSSLPGRTPVLPTFPAAEGIWWTPFTLPVVALPHLLLPHCRWPCLADPPLCCAAFTVVGLQATLPTPTAPPLWPAPRKSEVILPMSVHVDPLRSTIDGTR